ncbi:MAG: stalk domain-containing protein [Firmicutes bacterium]|nr:stalk domain-containing protein [Bacillota bacterium]
MYKRLKKHSIYLTAIVLTALLFAGWSIPPGLAATDIRLVIDGGVIETSPQPFIHNDRTLVPLRVISEQLGADVGWNNEDRTVHIQKGDRSVLLRIDSRLVEYDRAGEKTYNVSDVAPFIVEDRTVVPLRLVSNALGVDIGWDNPSRTVSIDSSKEAAVTPFYDMQISSVSPGQVITGEAELAAAFPGGVPSGASEIKYMLLNPGTGRGAVVARGSNMTGKYTWIPDMKRAGQMALAAVLYDANGSFIAGTAIPVQLAVQPKVTLTGITAGQVLEEAVTLGPGLNFVASYVKYEITNTDKDKVFITGELDPQGTYTWSPMFEDNGNVTFRVIAYDYAGQAYASQPVSAVVNLTKKLELRGVSEGSTVEKPVTLSVSRNFQVSETEYVMKDPRTGSEEVLARVGYVSHRWFPGTDLTGTRELFVRVKDTSGVTHTSESVTVKLTGAPKLLLEGVGPKQVVTGPLELKVTSNTPLQDIQFVLTNPQTGARKVAAGGQDAGDSYSWTPVGSDGGQWKMQAEATLPSGAKISSEAVPFRVYLGTLYSAKPVVEKDKFLDLASNLADASWRKTGMSAALQTAQAILETGWGQSVPADKYTGKFSYNLFGIKGTGPAGSVVSNTWEEYNGQAFRVDANFRAYNNVNESWAGHKDLLLTASRYQPFREVMHDSTQGAWALRRAGYATDSQYPIKLMNIIKTYGLEKLDEIGI